MENSFFDFNNLGLAIVTLLKARKISSRTISLACQIHPSYFSRAIKGDAALSQQQVFRIAGFLNLSDFETEYFFLLWNLSAAQSKVEKDFFQQKIRNIQNEKQKISDKIKAKILADEDRQNQLQNYYSEAITAMIHMYLTIPAFQHHPDLLVKELGISNKKLDLELEKLKKLRLIEGQGKKIIRVEESIHLPENSPLAFSNHINWRIRTIHAIEKRELSSENYHVSVVFSADAETKHKLKQLLRQTLLQAKGIVGDCASPNQVYHLMMDLF